MTGLLIDDHYLSVADAASELQVSDTTVRRAVREGTLNAIRLGEPGITHIPRAALRAFSKRVEGRAKARLSDEAYVQGSVPWIVRGHNQKGVPWTVINADATSGLQCLPDASANCIVTSPPYYWQRDYHVDGQIGHEDSVSGYVQSLVSVFREARRVLTDDGLLFLNLGDTYYSAKGRPHGRDRKHRGRQLARKKLRAVDGPGLGLPRKSLIGIPWKVAIGLQDDGWTLRSDIVWVRPGTMPEPTAKDRAWRTHEHIFMFSKGPRYWFERTGLEDQEDVWTFSARPNNPGSHYAPYPRELVERCLACGCPPGGVVLDPFVGSGTTMLAAMGLGNPAIGIDLKREYCTATKSRIVSDR